MGEIKGMPKFAGRWEGKMIYEVRPKFVSIWTLDDSKNYRLMRLQTFINRVKKQITWIMLFVKQHTCKHAVWEFNCAWQIEGEPENVGFTWCCQRCGVFDGRKTPRRSVK